MKMRGLLALAATMLVAILAMPSQVKGQLYVTGELGMNYGTNNGEKTVTTITPAPPAPMPAQITIGPNKGNTFTFSMAPGIGYCINENFHIGGYLGYMLTKTTEKPWVDPFLPILNNTVTTSTRHGVAMGVNALYIPFWFDRFGLAIEPTLGFSYGMGKERTKTTVGNATTILDTKLPNVITLGIGVAPALVVKFNEHLMGQIRLDILGLGYSMTKTSLKTSETLAGITTTTKSTSINHNFDFGITPDKRMLNPSALTLSVKYIF